MCDDRRTLKVAVETAALVLLVAVLACWTVPVEVLLITAAVIDDDSPPPLASFADVVVAAAAAASEEEVDEPYVRNDTSSTASVGASKFLNEPLSASFTGS